MLRYCRERRPRGGLATDHQCMWGPSARTILLSVWNPMLLVVLALYIYTADFPFSHDTANVSMGVIAGLCLGIVAVCGANENDLLHTS